MYLGRRESPTSSRMRSLEHRIFDIQWPQPIECAELGADNNRSYEVEPPVLQSGDCP